MVLCLCANAESQNSDSGLFNVASSVSSQLIDDCCSQLRRAIDHHWEDDKFATAGAAVDIWDHSRSEPISTYSWGADSVLSVRFNPVSSRQNCSTHEIEGVLNVWHPEWALQLTWPRFVGVTPFAGCSTRA